MQQRSVAGTLILLALVFVCAQLLFAGMHHTVMGMGQVERSAIIANLPLLAVPLGKLILAQLFIYAIYIYFLWLITLSLNELLLISIKHQHWTAVLIFVIASLTLLTLHTYLVTHSFFSQLISENIFNGNLGEDKLFWYSRMLLTPLVLLAVLTFSHILLSLIQRNNVKRNAIALTVILLICILFTGTRKTTQPETISRASFARPNIFIIGFDAVRPDFLSYFNQDAAATPALDAFLATATVFKQAYTPLARTFPSWTSLLTGQYPLHHFAREDNTNISAVALNETLPKALRKAGYTTIYASDDNRFGNINREFGFDHLLGNNGNVVDYLMSVVNDYPLSNLIIPTRLGKILFPYNHGNHGFAATYRASNFLEIIHQTLRSQGQRPLFMAVHFNITAFPFYRFNDHEITQTPTLNLYKNSIRDGDNLFNTFLGELSARGLLQHAIVVLISDHGITLAQPDDRITNVKYYQGNTRGILLKRTKYALIKTTLDSSRYQNNSVAIDTADISASPFNKNHYGIDTSFGYGGDVLSIKQNLPVFAIKTYGIASVLPQQIAGPALLLDITPTILDMLNLPALSNASGLSLKSYLFQRKLFIPGHRPVFLESGFSIPEIESDGIIIDKVVRNHYQLFEIDKMTGIVSMKADALKMINTQKQRAVIQGNWMLAYYPRSVRYREIINHAQKTIRYQDYIAPPYRVLVNLNTRQWTMDFKQPLVRQAPLAALETLLKRFYGQEMDYYKE